MPELTRRRYPEREECWRVYYGDVHVGTIARTAATKLVPPGGCDLKRRGCNVKPKAPSTELPSRPGGRMLSVARAQGRAA
jgi:hypothetical protein